MKKLLLFLLFAGTINADFISDILAIANTNQTMHCAIRVPGQDHSLMLDCSFTYAPPAQLQLAGWMEDGSFYGPPAFGIPGIALGEFGISGGIDVEQSIAQGSIALTNYELEGTLECGASQISLRGRVDADNPNIVMIGNADNLGLQDLALLVMDIMEVNGAQTITQDALFAAFQELLPPVTFKSVQIFIVPQDTTIFGTHYSQGTWAKTTFDCLGTNAYCDMCIGESGLSGKGLLNTGTIGSLTITGDPQSLSHDQASVAIDWDAIDLTGDLSIDGGIIIDVLGGINTSAKIRILPAGFRALCVAKICELFEADVTINCMSDAITDDTINVHVQLTNDGCDAFGQMMQNVAQQLMKSRNNFIENIENWGHHILAQTFSIQYVAFASSLADLKAGILPLAQIEGVIAGKQFNICMHIDLKDPQAIALACIHELNKMY